jgi:hypothetical protein
MFFAMLVVVNNTYFTVHTYITCLAEMYFVIFVFLVRCAEYYGDLLHVSFYFICLVGTGI